MVLGVGGASIPPAPDVSYDHRMLETLATARDLLLVVLGFSFVIFIHELGHFLAARWAGVRVEEFAIGFGKAAASYRKGLGFRRGSSRREFEHAVRAAIAQGGPAPAISATEYRLNWLPLGGYVRMLGQADLDPAATSALPDSYTSKPVWRRMVIITAGVAMNMILAAAIFVAVFMAGLRTEPPIIGYVRPDSAAALATPESKGGIGLKPGDRVVSIDGTPMRAFRDVSLAVAMSRKDDPIEIEVERPGEGALRYTATPSVGQSTRLLEIGVGPAVSATIAGADARRASDRRAIADELARLGLAQVEAGATLVSVNGSPATSGFDLDAAAQASGGRPVTAGFRNPSGATVAVAVPSVATLGTAEIPDGKDSQFIAHLGGLLPPLRVVSPTDDAAKAGLRDGDVLAQVASVEWPDTATAVREIKRRAGRTVPLVVMRDGRHIRLEPRVTSKGRVGFGIAPAAQAPAIVAGTLGSRHGPRPARPVEAVFDGANLVPGTLIERVNGTAVASFGEVRDALLGSMPPGGGQVTLRVRLPLGETFGAGPEEAVRLAVTEAQAAALRSQGWESAASWTLFEPLRTTLKADGPAGALAMGLSETKRMMMRTYLTLLRLTQGSVRVEHLNGPVGIAHLGTMVAEMGAMHLLFFLAVVSVNLAVLNFLPLPIVDGGLFVFLLIEALTRRPVSVAVQSAATMVGLVLLGAVFLVVTFHDITRLFGG